MTELTISSAYWQSDRNRTNYGLHQGHEMQAPIS